MNDGKIQKLRHSMASSLHSNFVEACIIGDIDCFVVRVAKTEVGNILVGNQHRAQVLSFGTLLVEMHLLHSVFSPHLG